MSKKREFSDEVRFIYSQHEEVKRYHQYNLDNTIENWRFYFAKNPELGLGQWPMPVVQEMIQQNRPLIQFNFCMPTIDVLVGSLMEIPMEPDYIPINSETTSLTKAVKSAMYSDRELMDWRGTFFDVCRAGLVGAPGVCKMVISDKYSELGNIGFETCLPGAVFPDPMWKTWRSSDCELVYKESWYTADKLAKMYPNAGDRIMAYAEQVKRDGVNYGQYGGVTPYPKENDMWGDALRIIEQYSMVNINKTIDYVITIDNDHLVIPGTIPEKDRYDWCIANIPGWRSDMTFCREEKKKICKVKTICPAIDTEGVLENKPTEVQIGATPFFFYSASRANGENHSSLDALKDPQRHINFQESMIENKMKVEGGGGAQFIDSNLFKNPREASKYKHHRNNPNATFELKDGYIEKGIVPVRPVLNSQFPTEAYKFLEHIIHVIWPNVSKVTPASLGMQEQGQANMSGKLYDSLKMQASKQAFTLHYGWRLFNTEIHEAYLTQAAQTYANEMVPRQFTYNGGREQITVNEPVSMPDGSTGIRNDMSKLSEFRHKVIISEKQETPTQRASDLEQLSKMFEALPPERNNTRNYVLNKMFQKLDQVPEDDKPMLEEIMDLEMQRDLEGLRAQVAMAKASRIQAEQQLKQAEGLVTQNMPAVPGVVGNEPMPMSENIEQTDSPQENYELINSEATSPLGGQNV